MILIILILWIAAIYWAYWYLTRWPQKFKDQRILITGGGNGLGRQIAHNLGEEGAKIYLWDIDKHGLDRTEKELKEKGVWCRTQVIDITKPALVYQAAKEIGDIDILINNAGIVTGRKFLDCTDEEVERTFRVNAISHFYTVRAFLPGMLERKKGHLVTIASAASLVGTAGLSDYCGSKFAAAGAHESLWMEFQKYNIPISTTIVYPYFINTALFAGVKSKFSLFFPILEESYVAKRVVKAIRYREEELMIPYIMKLFYVIRAAPLTWQIRFIKALGFSDSMDSFTGRSKKGQ